MKKAEIECQHCGAGNHDQAEQCHSCGKRLYTVEVTVQSGSGAPRTSSDDFGPAQGSDALREADVSTDLTIDSTPSGPPTHEMVGTLVGEYRVTRLIGEGGMGTVFAGEQPLIGKKVAIKVLKPVVSGDADVVERFLAEAKAVNTIRHPNIIDIFSFGTLEDGSQYFVMEYISGRSLASHLKKAAPIDYPEGVSIFRQVLDALKSVHDRGIVHRDLKPDNIYLGDHPSGGFNVKLLDFGIAKFTEEGITSGHTRTGEPIGTPKYMSPEQCYGRDVDHQSDIYSIGVILYQTFTGQPPFSAKSVYQLVDSHVHTPPVKPSSLVEFPEDLERIILWCLAKKKEERPESVAELQGALLPVLERLATDGPAAPPPLPTLPPLSADSDRKSARPMVPAEPERAVRGRGRAALFIVLGMLIAAVVVAALLLMRRPEKQATSQEPPPPPTTMATPDAAPTPPKPDLVLLQFQVSPREAKHRIFVNGKVIPGRLHEMPRHRSRPVKVKIVAPGYHPYEADWVPYSSLPIQVTLVKKSKPKPMYTGGHHRRRRRLPPVMHPMRPEMLPDMRPTMGGFDML